MEGWGLERSQIVIGNILAGWWILGSSLQKCIHKQIKVNKMKVTMRGLYNDSVLLSKNYNLNT